MTEHVLSTLDNSRKYTLAVADAMPESGYNTRPSEEVWDFMELLHHIAYGIQWWEDNYIQGKKTGWDPPPVKATKKEVMEYLENAYSSLKKTMMKAGKKKLMWRIACKCFEDPTEMKGTNQAILRDLHKRNIFRKMIRDIFPGFFNSNQVILFQF